MFVGLEVMVKFRDKYDLQRLDPFKQSGGERSVSTALYMMAMQHMTQVRNLFSAFKKCYLMLFDDKLNFKLNTSYIFHKST